MNKMVKKFGLCAYLTPTGDNHLNEYIGPSDERVKFLTNFSGSNGLAITCDKNVLYTDSRYYIQAEKELIGYDLIKSEDMTLEVFLDQNIASTKLNTLTRKVGVNPSLFSYKWLANLKTKLSRYNIEIIYTEDLVDKLWTDKPLKKFNKIYSVEKYKIHDFYLSNFKMLGCSDYKPYMLDKDLHIDTLIVGKLYKDKLDEIRKMFKSNETLILTELDTICWVYNLRGNDIKYNPVFYAYSVITHTSAILFCKYDISLDNVEVRDYDEFFKYIKKLDQCVISGECNGYIDNLLENTRYTNDIRGLQSKKSKEEMEGFHLANLLDGVALVELFDYIELQNKVNITEKNIAQKLLELKSTFDGFMSPSFESIVGHNENSAIVHYSAGDVVIKYGILLMDVGSNYLFGTTDTSRTLCIGNPSDKMKEIYTKVLKGQIAAMSQVFPQGVNGSVIDALTRICLWSDKLDYGHASGHGIGHFLCVHEHPPTLSPNSTNKVLLNQVFSIEPGLYIENEFGIRLENMVYPEDIGKSFMRLVNFTYVPYHLLLIDIKLLTEKEIAFFNQMSSTIKKLISIKASKYLRENTLSLYK